MIELEFRVHPAGAKAMAHGLEWTYCARAQEPGLFTWWALNHGLCDVAPDRHLKLAIAGIWRAVFPQSRRKNRWNPGIPKT